MPYIYRNLTISSEEGDPFIPCRLSEKIGCKADQIKSVEIIRKAVDARHKSSIKFIYTVLFDTTAVSILNSVEKYQKPEYPEFPKIKTKDKIVIAGMGPAGIFAALRLAEYGISATIVERGDSVENRGRLVGRFWNGAQLDTECNVQFGEGGAGTFSDGKLTCRTTDPNSYWILQRFVDFGASNDILYQAKPHIGTDILKKTLINIRHYLLSKEFEIKFRSKMTDIKVSGDTLSSVIINNCEELDCNHLIVATGHSARDSYAMLQNRVVMEQKPFAVGVRVEHPQELIDSIQFGNNRSPLLSAADYAVTYNNKTTGRSGYSFCMCPGGVVIGGSSEAFGVVTNGMSLHGRNSGYSNSAIVVNVKTSDFGGSDPLAGARFQQKLERAAFEAGGRNYAAPAENILSFLKMKRCSYFKSTYKPSITEYPLEKILPEFVTDTLRESIIHFNQKMKRFITEEAMLVAVESRTSAPLRILRGEDFQSLSLKRLYPAGEGAGYAGGIMSAAADGVRIADAIAASLKQS